MIRRLLARGKVAEILECGHRVMKLCLLLDMKPEVFREVAVNAAVEALGLPVPTARGVREVCGRWGGAPCSTEWTSRHSPVECEASL